MTDTCKSRKMTGRHKPLPEFASPPVVEVAVSVRFDAPVLDGPLIALRWGQVRDRFPLREEASPLTSTIETFGGPQEPRIEIQFSGISPTQRLLMLSRSKTKLLQIQKDLFGYSWRKLQPQHEYPRYEKIRNDFECELANFQTFLSAERLEHLSSVQCEITYVNLILPEENVWSNHSELGKVIPSAEPRLTEGFLPPPEQTRYVSQYVISGEDDIPQGRLYVSVEPTYHMPDKTPMYLMKLTFRGDPQGDGPDGIIKAMDLGHEWIVQGFATLTSSKMHRVWRRTN